MIGLLELLNANFDIFDNRKKKQFIEMIFTSAHKLQNEMLNILEWALSQAQIISYSPEPVELKILVEDIITLLKQVIINKNISIELKFEEKIFAFVDRRMINTVIRNILANAIKFTPQNGNIVINCLLSNLRTVQITITDSGVGMTPQQIEKAFDKNEFNSTYGTNNEKGTGLGLKICHDFVLKNNGSINITSKINNGTSIILNFPVCEDRIENDSAPQNNETDTNE
ncbi:MAG: HAMP domain-containing histidine kinase [Bacteroidales bacterium]|nr:HAMP domain-containing histidine kinase [Bacteroidales bacterium]